MTGFDLQDFMFAVAVECGPVEARLRRVLLTPVEGDRLPLVADDQCPTGMLRWEAHHKRTELVSTAGRIDVWTEEP